MSEAAGIIAAHYIYMLKDDEDLSRIWSALTDGSSITAEPFSLDLASGKGSRHNRGCSVINRSSGNGRDLCLGMLPELAAVEIMYRGDRELPLEEQWQAAVGQIAADREKAGVGKLTLMGETTLLVSSERSADELVGLADKLFPEGHLLISGIDPALAGGKQPLWAYVSRPQRDNREYFFLAADKTDALIESMLPEADSYIKKITKTAKYFSHQRQTIVKERLKVDKDVGAILHEQVVAGNGAYDPEWLEEKITTLSRMFGILATDSQLVRQAVEQLERDKYRLDHALSPIRVSGGKDEIAEYLTTRFDSDFAKARTESENLDFSRQNAQAAIEVVRTQVDLLRAGEEAALQAQTKEVLDRSLLLQEERLAIQVAAVFLEFVLVFYYTLKSWEGVAGHAVFEHVPPLLRLVIVAGVAAGVTLGTHSLAEAIQQKKANNGIWLALAIILISLGGLVTLSVMYA